MKWFKNPATIEELKKQYRNLAMKHHPDIGGSESDMKEINAEYDNLFERLKNIHQTAEGKTYTAKESTTESPEEFREIVEKLICLDGITIELCGSWLWVTGNTIKHKETLKELKFRWSKSKLAWYYHREEYSKFSKKKFSLDEIRSLYGSETITGTKDGRLKSAYN